jgi:Protein of unknown function (DUF2934)
MSTQTAQISDDQIRAIAYKLWLEEGCPEGRAEHHWFKANELAATSVVIPDLVVAKPKRKPAAKKASKA